MTLLNPASRMKAAFSVNGLSVLRLQYEERDERDGDEGQRERGHGDTCGIVAVGAALRGDHGDDGHGGKRRDECDGGHHVGGQRRLVQQERDGARKQHHLHNDAHVELLAPDGGKDIREA